METETKKKKTKKKEDFDLGKTPISKLFITIWVPTLISNLIGGTFIIFDSIFISHGYHAGSISEGGIWFWSNSGYASIGSTGMSYVMPYTLLMISGAMIVGGSISNYMLKAKSAGDQKKEQQLLNSYLPTAIILGLILMIILIPFAKFFIWVGTGFQKVLLDNWYNNPLTNSSWTFTNSADAAGHIFSQASWYLRIQALAAIPYIYMYAGAYILRIEGKTFMATRINLIALGANILLDFLLIIVFGMNLVGAAIATVVAEMIGATFYFFYFKYYFPLKATKMDWAYTKQNFFSFFKNGISYAALTFLQVVLILIFTFSIGIVYYNQPEINAYTSAFQTWLAFYTLIYLVVIGTIMSIIPIVTYNHNIGAEKRTKEAIRLGFWFLTIFSIFFTILLIFFPDIITVLFNSEKPDLTQRMSQILILTFFFAAIILYSSNILQSIEQKSKSHFLVYSKPILLFILTLILGFGLNSYLCAWQNSVLPWNLDLTSEIVNSYSFSIFWSLPITEIIIGGIALYWLIDAYNKLDK